MSNNLDYIRWNGFQIIFFVISIDWFGREMCEIIAIKYKIPEIRCRKVVDNLLPAGLSRVGPCVFTVLNADLSPIITFPRCFSIKFLSLSLLYHKLIFQISQCKTRTRLSLNWLHLLHLISCRSQFACVDHGAGIKVSRELWDDRWLWISGRVVRGRISGKNEKDRLMRETPLL